MKEVRFDSAFNFKYSPRIGTKASEFEDQLSEKIKQKRLERVIDLQKTLNSKKSTAYWLNPRCIG